MANKQARKEKSSDTQRMNAIRGWFLDRRYRIVYFVPFEREPLEDASIFRLYSENLMKTSLLHVRAAGLPADVRELSSDWETIYRFRRARIIENLIIPIYIDSLVEAAQAFDDRPFKVVLTDDETADRVDELLPNTSLKWVHLSTSPVQSGRISLTGLTWASFRDALRNLHLTEGAFEGPMGPLMRVFDEVTSSTPPSETEDLLYDPTAHNITSINQISACCYGVRSREVKPILMEQQAYRDAVVEAAAEVFHRREQLSSFKEDGAPPYRLALAAPSLLGRFYSNKFTKNNDLKKADPVLQKFVLETIRQSTYFYKTDSEKLRAFMRSKSVRYLTQVSTDELATFSTSLTVFSARTLTPVVRIEPSINSVRSILSKIAHLARGNNNRRRFKVNAAAKEAMQHMADSIAPEYQQLLINPKPECREGIKLVTDLPLEWVPVDDLPLMMAYETSRVPVTPGNVNLEQLVVSRAVHLKVENFSKVLVIRSFDKHDPIRGLLEAAIGAMELDNGDLPVSTKIVDVETVEDFVSAWNAFDGAIVIFDGHGVAEDDTGVGSLIIGGARVNVWELRERLTQNPPIVITSACDTHSVDSGHATVGNALLMLGATSAIATFLPVDARYSASFIARLLLRVANYVPVAANFSNLFRPLTWRSVVTGMQRMVFVTEILKELEAAGTALTSDQVADLQMAANVDINAEVQDWYRKFLTNLSASVGESEDAIRSKISTWATLVDVMLYVQLGNPESIVITSE
ncbi:CHAT domain-containing protein [Paraburkholderia sp. BR14263]